MIRRHPAMLAALMLCALPERAPTPEEERERTLKKLRTDLAREGESPEEILDWGWAYRAEASRLTFEALAATPVIDPETFGLGPRAIALAEFAATPSSLTPIKQAIGRSMTEVNRERRARGELGTRRQRKARRG